MLSALEAAAIGTLLCQAGEEGLHGGIVIAIGSPAHAHLDAQIMEERKYISLELLLISIDSNRAVIE